MTKSTPLALIGFLGGGTLIFDLHVFFPVPVEGWFAVVGMVVFAAGMLFGLVGVFRGIAMLINSRLRAATGIIVPGVTILIACGAWFAVVSRVIEVNQSLEQRNEFEQEHQEQSNGTPKDPSQPSKE